MWHARNTTRLENELVEADFYRRPSNVIRRSAMRKLLRPKAAAFKIAISTFALVLLVATVVSSAVLGQANDGHTILIPSDIRWSAAPSSIPAGAQASVLYGDPGKDGLFALRLKLPKGYAIAPHTHPKPELVTVISGTFRLGMGDSADRSKGQPLAAGSFFALQPGMAHFAFADEDTVVQLNSTGPWTLTYVNPSDDPRKTQ